MVQAVRANSAACERTHAASSRAKRSPSASAGPAWSPRVSSEWARTAAEAASPARPAEPPRPLLVAHLEPRPPLRPACRCPRASPRRAPWLTSPPSRTLSATCSTRPCSCPRRRSAPRRPSRTGTRPRAGAPGAWRSAARTWHAWCEARSAARGFGFAEEMRRLLGKRRVATGAAVVVVAGWGDRGPSSADADGLHGEHSDEFSDHFQCVHRARTPTASPPPPPPTRRRSWGSRRSQSRTWTRS